MKHLFSSNTLSSCIGRNLLALFGFALAALSQTLQAQEFNWSFSPTAQWAEGTANPTINVDSSGTFDANPAEVSIYLQGDGGNSALGKTITFNITTPSYGIVGVDVSGIATWEGSTPNLSFQISDNGSVISTKTFSSTGTWEVGIPAGTHEIVIEGIGDDWISVASYYFKDSTPPTAGEVENFTWTADTVGVYAKAEASFDITNEYSNPFDPDIADVMVEVWGPNGENYELPAFWYVPYSINPGGAANPDYYAYAAAGEGTWMLRFAPESAGTWTISISITDEYGSSTSNTYSLTAVDQGLPGFIHCDPYDRQGYRFSDGSPYVPLGMNLGWNGGRLDDFFKDTLQKMGDNGMNWSRYWLVGFARQALEWTSMGWFNEYTGLGQYSQGPATLLDEVLDAHEANGVYTQLVLEQHGKVSTHVDATWNDNPYNTANGGDAATPSEWFTESSSKELIKKKYRYIIARYSYSTHIFNWELFNEVHWVKADSVSTSAVASWHTEMATYIKSIDPYQHIIATSADDEYLPSLDDIEDIDLLQDHKYDTYNTGIVHGVADFDDELLADYSKPVLVGEYGGGSGYDTDTHADHLRQIIWIGAMKRVPNMIWAWSEYIIPQDLFHVYQPLADYLADEDIAIQSNLAPINPTVESSDGTADDSQEAYGLQSNEAVYVYIRDSDVGDWSDSAATISGRSLHLSNLPEGKWQVSYTFPYAETTSSGPKVEADGSNDLRIALPDYSRDIAIKLKPAFDNYQDWQGRIFTQAEIDSGLADPLESAGFDGTANLLKFAFGSQDPSAPLTAPTLPHLIRDGSQIDLKLNTTGDNLIYILETSTDLGTWTELTRFTEASTEAQQLDIGSLLQSSHRAFVRIRVVTVDG